MVSQISRDVLSLFYYEINIYYIFIFYFCVIAIGEMEDKEYKDF